MGALIVDCRSTHDASIKKGRHLVAFFITSRWSMKLMMRTFPKPPSQFKNLFWNFRVVSVVVFPR